MQIIRSIQTADRVIETQTRPVQIGCEDFNDYVCKYSNGNGFAKRLFCEYLAASFLKIWELNIPDFAFVNINSAHIPQHFKIPKHNFNTTCFGLRYSRNYADLTKIEELKLAANFKSATQKNNFLKIALFDIWLANEDRNNNNYNLLFDLQNNYTLIPIDHEGIFNTRIFDNAIYELNEGDSILCTSLAQLLLNKTDLTIEIIEHLKDYFYICVQQCEKDIDKIIENVPPNWQIDNDLVSKKMDEIFSEIWKKTSVSLFQSFIQSF